MKDININRFIYLDSEILDSCCSQAFDGIITKNTSSRESSSSSDLAAHGEVDINGEAGAKVLGVGAKGSWSTKGGARGAIGKLDRSENTAECQPLDDRHNKLLEYLSDNKLLSYDIHNALIGDFIEFSGDITVIDKDIISAFSRDKAMLNNMLSLSTGEKTTSPAVDANSIAGILDIISFLMPYDVFAKVDDAIVVLKKESFKMGESVSPHMFGGKITVLGYVTNEICSTCTSDENAFAALMTGMNAALCGIFGANTMKIVCPISLYYK